MEPQQKEYTQQANLQIQIQIQIIYSINNPQPGKWGYHDRVEKYWCLHMSATNVYIYKWLSYNVKISLLKPHSVKYHLKYKSCIHS